MMADSTIKTKAAPAMNEREYALYLYNQALKKMVNEPTQENIAAFGSANEHLFRVEDSYRIAARLLMERAQNLKNAVRGLFK